MRDDILVSIEIGRMGSSEHMYVGISPDRRANPFLRPRSIVTIITV
jgi:hypothetical protein